MVQRARAVVRTGVAVIKGHLGKKVPMNIMWRITNKCNSKCGYCSIWKRKQKELSTEQAFGLIDEMHELGTARIGFVGGEAFLRPDFGRIVDYVKSKGIYVTLVTNGCLVPQNVPILKKLDYLVISFDGRKKSHEKGRMKNSYDNVIRAFEICRDNSIKVLTNTVLNSNNLDDLDYILDTAKKYGFHCTFNVLQGGNMYPDPEKYREALRHLIKRKKEGAPIVLSERTMKFLIEWKDYQKYTEKNHPGFRCWAGGLIFNIDTDGKIAACDIMTHQRKDNPDATKGLKQAIEKVRKDCDACTCSHVIEYNYMFSLKPDVIMDWGRMVFG